MSQRVFAKRAGISYKALQLVETGKHNTSLSTLEKIATAANYPEGFFLNYVSLFFQTSELSLHNISKQIVLSQKHEWQIPLFNFVDNFRKHKLASLITEPPCSDLSDQLRALLSATTETLCEELKVSVPWWCQQTVVLDTPWFVAGVENLKAMAIVESPVHFRKRNIFVLKNFLQRA